LKQEHRGMLHMIKQLTNIKFTRIFALAILFCFFYSITAQPKLAANANEIDSIRMSAALQHFAPSGLPVGKQNHNFPMIINRTGDTVLWMNSYVSSKKFAAQTISSLSKIPAKDTAQYEWVSPYLGFVQFYNATVFLVDTMDKMRQKGKLLPVVIFSYDPPADAVSWLSGPEIQMLKSGKFLYKGEHLNIAELLGILKRSGQSKVVLIVEKNSTINKLKPVRERFKKAGIDLVFKLKTEAKQMKSDIETKREDSKTKTKVKEK
jgi:hypothetical protein